jgi:D-alanyl-D-alanine carboxypeptidase
MTGWVTTTTPYAVLNAQGQVISGNQENSRQDPASTTKVWTLYTILSLVEDGVIPRSFLDEHRGDIRAMMVRSDNDAAQRLATEAARAAGVDVGRVNGALDAVPGFARLMNYYADPQAQADQRPPNVDDAEHARNVEEAGGRRLAGTRFVTASGMPASGHYSTPRDMAMMILRLRTDFTDTDISRWVHAADLDQARNTGGFAEGHSEQGKTGTATGLYGTGGRYSFVGATENGVYAIAGAATKEVRVSRSADLARIASAAPGELPALNAEIAADIRDNDVSTTDYLTPEQRARRVELTQPGRTLTPDEQAELQRLDEAERVRRQEADGHDPYTDAEAHSPNNFINAFVQAILRLFGINTDTSPTTTPETAPDSPAPSPVSSPAPTERDAQDTVPTVVASPDNAPDRLLTDTEDRGSGIALLGALRRMDGDFNNAALLHNLSNGGITVSELRAAAGAAVALGVFESTPASLNFDNNGHVDAGDVTALTRIITDAAQARPR